MQDKYAPPRSDLPPSLTGIKWRRRAIERHQTKCTASPCLPLRKFAQARLKLYHRRRAFPASTKCGVQRRTTDGLGCLRDAAENAARQRRPGRLDLLKH